MRGHGRGARASGIATRTFGLALLAAAFVAASSEVAAPEGQCDSADGECGAGSTPLPPDAAAAQELLEQSAGNGTNSTNGTNATKKREPLKLEDLGWWRIGLLLSLLGAVMLWIAMTIKFAIDGSLPARLALWGFLPEAYAAISVRAVCALLRLKTNPTPVIVLRNCVTSDGAKELAVAMRTYATAGLEALELPHNPQMGQEGVRALVSASFCDACKLEDLDFSYNPHLKPFIVAEVRPLLPSKASRLTTLKLADCGLDKAELEKLADALKRSGLRTVDISLNPLAGAGEAIVAVCDAPVLEEIVIGRCGLNTEDIGAIAENLPFTGIKSIGFGGNRMGKAGLEAIVDHLPSCQVDELGLEANALEISDLTKLGEAWVKRPFSRVKLSGNRMTNEEIAGFVSTLKSLHA